MLSLLTARPRPPFSFLTQNTFAVLHNPIIVDHTDPKKDARIFERIQSLGVKITLSDGQEIENAAVPVGSDNTIFDLVNATPLPYAIQYDDSTGAIKEMKVDITLDAAAAGADPPASGQTDFGTIYWALVEVSPGTATASPIPAAKILKSGNFGGGLTASETVTPDPDKFYSLYIIGDGRNAFNDEDIAPYGPPDGSQFRSQEVLYHVTLLKVDLEVPKLDANGNEISDEFVTAQELKVGKMEGAIGGSPTGLTIDDDVDRFYVKIPGLTGMTDVSVKIETIDNPDYALDYSDDPNWVELEELADGSGYRSPSQLLVSDDVDDDEDLHDVGADDQLNDRTHKVQLGGKLKMSALKINGIEHQVSITKDVKVRKELDVTFVILRKNGVAITSGAELSGQLQQLRERFAQIGVKVNLATPGIEYADVEQMESDGVQVPYDADGDDEFEPGQTSAPSADERLLFDSYGTTDFTSDVRIFYVEELAGFNVGLAYTAEAAQELGRPEWANNIVMSKVANLRDLSPVLFVLPHEVTHLLLDDDLPDDGHLADQKNLMHGTSFTIDWIGGRKRLNREQEVMIFENDEGLLE